MLYGSPIAVYRANWILVILFVAGAAVFGPLAVFMLQRGGTWIAALIGLFAFGFGAGALTLVFTTIRLFHEGIVAKSLFDEKEMRWDQVDSLYFQAYTHREYGVPIMTSYSLRMVDMSSNVLKIPAGLGRARQLATLVVQQATPPIMERLLQRFKGGERLSFGSVHISLSEGIEAKANALRTVLTPWSMFAGTTIKGGLLYILRHDRTSGGVAVVARTPNAFALQNLLAQVIKKDAKVTTPSAAQQVKAAKS